MYVTDKFAIQWISVKTVIKTAASVVIYPVNSVIHLSNNPGLDYKL